MSGFHHFTASTTKDRAQRPGASTSSPTASKWGQIAEGTFPADNNVANDPCSARDHRKNSFRELLAKKINTFHARTETMVEHRNNAPRNAETSAATEQPTLSAPTLKPR